MNEGEQVLSPVLSLDIFGFPKMAFPLKKERVTPTGFEPVLPP